MKFINAIKKEIAMRRGQSLFGTNSYESAYDQFALAGGLDSTDAFPHLWMGFCLTELEKYEAAHEKYVEAVSRAPDNMAFKAFWAINYIDQGSMDEALKLLMPLISLPGAPRPVHDSYGLYLLHTAKVDEAHKVLTSHSKHLGVSRISARVFSLCEKYLAESIQISLELEENIDQEIQHTSHSRLRTVIAKFYSGLAFWNRSNSVASDSLAQVEKAIDQKDYLTAKQLISALMETKPSDKVTLSSVKLLIRMKEYESALEILDKIADEKKMAESKALKVLVLLRLRRLQEAEMLLYDISSGEDNLPEISYLYALLYIQQGSFGRARKKIEKVLKVVKIGVGLDLTAIRLREVLRVYSLINERH